MTGTSDGVMPTHKKAAFDLRQIANVVDTLSIDPHAETVRVLGLCHRSIKNILNGIETRAVTSDHDETFWGATIRLRKAEEEARALLARFGASTEQAPWAWGSPAPPESEND